MVAILGGALLCGLDDGNNRVEAVRTGTPVIGSESVSVNDEEFRFPYYKIDDMPRNNGQLVDDYLDRVVAAVLEKTGRSPADLRNLGISLGFSSVDYSLVGPFRQNLYGSFRPTDDMKRVGGGLYVDRLMQRFDLPGLSWTYNTACTSSANALMDAAALLKGEVIDYALVLGLELYWPTILEGFFMMQLLSPDKIRPFDRDRNGIVLGEAVSAVLLSRENEDRTGWTYLGGMSNCETHSVTGANPTGDGIAAVMRGVLNETGLAPEDIVAVKTHGTASELNDLAEVRGMEQVFPSIPPYLSLKPYLGHTLGGCGTAEMLLLMEAGDAGFVPPTIHFENLDPQFTTPPILEPLPFEGGRLMLNYFGFGGNNTSFVIEKTTP